MEKSYRIITIYESKLDKMKSHLEKIAKAYSKLGLTFDYEITDAEPEIVRKGRVSFAISRKTVRYCDEVVSSGYVLAGVSDWTATPYLHSEFLDGFKITDIDEPSFVCEKCGSKRKRNKTFYVVHEETVEVVKVGSTCLKDFLDINPNMFSLYPMFEPLDEDYWGGRFFDYDRDVLHSVESIIGVSHYVNMHGGYEKGSPTVKSHLNSMYHYMDLSKEGKENIDGIYEWMAKHDGYAEKVIAYWETVESSDFADKIKLALSEGHVSAKWVGIVSYAAEGFRRHEEKMAEAKDKADSTHYGEVGNRYELNLNVTTIRGIDTDFGYSILAILEDANGNVFKIFSTSSFLFDLETGDEVKMKATIKDHTEYNGIKQTSLSRPSLVKTKDAVA